MVSKTVTVINEQGIHMRPAGLISKAVAKFAGTEVLLKVSDKTIKAKAIMQIMAAAIKKSTEVTIEANGPDEDAAVNELVNLFETGFGE